MWGESFLTIMGMTGLVLASAVSARAQTPISTMVSDFESGGSTNNLGGYWYFYDDRTSAGESVVTTADSAFQYQWDSTTFVPGSGGSEKGVKLGFILGTASPSCGTGCTFPSQVGMGTNMPGDTGLDITGAMSISFWAKADAPLKVVFTVGTSDVTDNGSYADVVPVTTEWTQYTVPLVPGKDFAQPSWAVKKAFNPAHFNSLGWMVGKGGNAGLTQGAFYLDNVSIEGWAPPAIVDRISLAGHSAGDGKRAMRLIGTGNLVKVELTEALRERPGTLEAMDARGQVLGRASFGKRDAEVALHLKDHASRAPVYLSVTSR